MHHARLPPGIGWRPANTRPGPLTPNAWDALDHPGPWTKKTRRENPKPLKFPTRLVESPIRAVLHPVDPCPWLPVLGPQPMTGIVRESTEPNAFVQNSDRRHPMHCFDPRGTKVGCFRCRLGFGPVGLATKASTNRGYRPSPPIEPNPFLSARPSKQFLLGLQHDEPSPPRHCSSDWLAILPGDGNEVVGPPAVGFLLGILGFETKKPVGNRPPLPIRALRPNPPPSEHRPENLHRVIDNNNGTKRGECRRLERHATKPPNRAPR